MMKCRRRRQVVPRVVFAMVLMVGICRSGRVDAAIARTIYVCPGGDDGNAGSLTSPLKTINAARQAVRATNRTMNGDIVVYLQAGTYPVTTPIRFSEEDSGFNGNRVVYQSLDAPGSARLLGGERVTNWVQHTGSIYKANVGVGWQFSTLTENGVRAQIARYPNRRLDPSYPTAQAPYLYTEGAAGSRNVVQYRTEDFAPGAMDLSQLQVVIWSGGGWDWFVDVSPAKTVNPVTRQMTLVNDLRYVAYLPVDSDGYIPGTRNSRYFLQNSLGFLDEPGEFYLDRGNGVLYYWPRSDDIANQVILAPHVRRIVEFIGSGENRPVHDVVLDGLSFELSDFADSYRFGWPQANGSGENHAYPSYDRQIEMPLHRTGMIFLQNTNQVTVQNCHLKNSGYSGFYLLFANQQDRIYGNWIEHTGYSGIAVEGPYPGEGNTSHDNVFSNNLIQNVGEILGHASGISIGNSGANEVSFSEIALSPRYAIQYYGDTAIPQQDIYTRNNSFNNLWLHDVGHDSGDTGAFYAWATAAWRNTASQLRIDSVRHHPSSRDAAPHGVFLDDQTNGQVISNARMTDVQGKPVNVNQSDGHVFNNVTGNASFDPLLVDVPHIGLKSDFIYLPSALSNISIRGFIPIGEALTPGFVMGGSGSKDLVVRAIGPTLTKFGIQDAVTKLQLTLYAQASGLSLLSNQGWKGDPALKKMFGILGAFPLEDAAEDAALYTNLVVKPGGFSVQVTPAGASGGVALIEVYDADPINATAHLMNISALGVSGPGARTLTAGFVVAGARPKRVLIRAVGPGLSPFGVTNIMRDPKVLLYPSGASSPSAQNDDWNGDSILRAAFVDAGAFALVADSKDAAMLATLTQGNYTIRVEGEAPGGNVLVEVYDLDR